MTSTPHASIVGLFRDNPELLPTLLREALHLQVPAYTEVRSVDADFTEPAAEFRADLVLILYFDGQPVLAVIIEVQLARDADKPWVWPAYVSVERARRRCPTALLVVTPSEEVAAWAGQVIVDSTLGGVSLRPMVAGPRHFPGLPPDKAAQEPEMALLSVYAHESDPRLAEVATWALTGFKNLPPDRRKLYYRLVFALLRRACRKGLLEKQIMTHFEQGLREDLGGFYEDGLVKAKADAVLAFLRARGLPLSEPAEKRILSCTDLAVLDRWIRRAAIVTSTDGLFLDS